MTLLTSAPSAAGGAYRLIVFLLGVTILTLFILSQPVGSDHYTMVPDMCAGDPHPEDMPIEALPAASPMVVGNREAPPPKPTGLTVTEVTRNTITLTWNRTPDAAGYRLFFNGHPADRTPILFYRAEDLYPGTDCVIQVAAFNNLGESELSEPIVVTTLSAGPPEAPTLGAGTIGLFVLVAGLVAATKVNRRRLKI